MRNFIQYHFDQLYSSNFTTHVLQTSLTKILMMMVALGTHIILARYLGPIGRGEYTAVAAVIILIIKLSSLGFPAANVYYSAKNPNLVSSLLGNSLIFSLILGCISSLLIFILSLIWPDFRAITNSYLIWVILAIPFGLFHNLAINLVLGLQKILAFNFIDLFLKFSSFIFILFLIILGLQKPFYYVANITFGYILSTLILYLFFRRRNITPNIDVNLFKENVRFASYTYLTNLCAIIIFNIDLIMVSSFLGAESAGYYSITLALSNGILLFPELIGSLLFSRLSKSYDKLKKWKQTKKVCFYLVLFMSPLLVTAGLFAHFTVIILFGKKYLPAVESFIWTLPAIFFLSIGSVLQRYLSSCGLVKWLIWGPLVAVFLSISMNYLMLERFGLIAAPISSICAYICLILFSLFFCLKANSK